MTIDDLFRVCKSLSRSQGFYGRLLEDLQEMSDECLDDLDCEIQKANLKTDLDLILWLES